MQHYSATKAGRGFAAADAADFFPVAMVGWVGDTVWREAAAGGGACAGSGGFGLLTRSGMGGGYFSTVLPATIVLGLGMSVSVAPLTTTVMNSIEQSRAGVASGVNNAVSRIAALLAVAVLGAVFSFVFNRGIDQGFERLSLPVAEREQVNAQRAKLAAMTTDDPRVREMIGQSFVDAYGVVLWIAAGLALSSSLSAAVMIDG